MVKKMTKKQKEDWDQAQEFVKDLKESALKECHTDVNCQVCGELIGCASKELYFEDFQIICLECEIME